MASNYWRDRAEADMDAVQAVAEKRIAMIGRAYHKAAQDLTENVKKIIGTYAQRMGMTREEALEALRQPFDEDSRAYSYRMTREEALLEASRAEAQRLGVLVNDETGKQRNYTAGEAYRRARKLFQDRVGATMAFAQTDTVGLMKSIGTCWAGKSYSQRIWKDAERLASTLQEEITAAFLSGKSNRKIEQVIMERFGVGFRQAERLVRTETSYVANKAALQSYRDAGLEEYEFLTAKDSRTCKVCAGMDGKRFSIDEQLVGVNAPPMHPNCRCTVLPGVESALGGLTDEEMRQWVKDGAPEDVEGWLQNRRGNDTIKQQGSDSVNIQSPINTPIEQRNTAKGNPNAILQYDRSLNNRQQALLEKLPEFNSRAIVPKRTVNMRDLAALTAKTGDEFALFTKNGSRLVIRGDKVHVNVTPELAQELSQDGYRWSGHTHPGIDFLSTQPSDGDYAILDEFKHDRTMICNSKGIARLIDRRDTK